MGKDYVFASSMIRGLEGRLLTADQLRSLAESKNPSDIYKVLSDAGYGSESSTISAENYEEMLKAEELKVLDELQELTESDPIFKIFEYQADYHNIKVLLKAEALGVDRSDILMHTGSIDTDELKEYVAERNKQELTENMGTAIDLSIDTHARTKDPQYIDFICDRYCFKDINEAVAKSGNEFAEGYVRLLIDTINLKTVARLKKLGQPKRALEQVFIPDGNIDELVFSAAFDEDWKQASANFEPYAVYPALEEGIPSIEKSGSFTVLEKKCDDILMDYARDAKFEPFGIEPLLAYMISKQSEIKCIRILMTGKIAEMDSQIIRERMRETYE